ncbi:hypothetical protein MMC14_000127 [Varicellaria rhodocarpa]|nr:hypothetical protein [Varicellaria rhodocarpa]
MAEPHEQIAYLILGSELLGLGSDENDERGVPCDPPPPLPFYRVNEGQPPQSNAPLFQLPAEILAEIPRYFPSDSLASLALVNHDCRQLARSRQFVSITLDYRPESLRLVEKLFSEYEERLENNGLITQPSLGACIRHITVSADCQWFFSYHKLKDRKFLSCNYQGMLKSELEEAHRAYFGQYLEVLLSMVSSRATLPHLKSFDWRDKLTLPRSYFNAIACSSIQHLRLDRVEIDAEFKIELPKELKRGGWPLSSLHLNLSSNRMLRRKKFRIFPLCCSILRLCASTLESLTWIGGSYKNHIEHDYNHYDAGDCLLLHFTKLRELKLNMKLGSCSSMLDELLQDGLRTLAIVNELNQTQTDFFRRRGRILSLETLL